MLVTLPVLAHGAVSPAKVADPPFSRMGGEDAVARLVERFYFYMDARSEAATIRGMHPPALEETKRVLRLYLGEWLGGPERYTPERGHPRLRRRHAGFAIDTAAREAWMTCMRLALADVVPDQGLRAELEQAFFKLADFLRNAPEPMGSAPPR